MVQSRLDPTIFYPDTKALDKTDVSMEAELYVVDANEVSIVIATGSAKNTHDEKNITYFPVYLVKPNNKVVQIGLYEVYSTDLLNYQDAALPDGHISIDKLEQHPLLYTFATKSYLNKFRMVPPSEEDIPVKLVVPEKDAVIPEYRQDVFTMTKGIPTAPLLEEETPAKSNEIKSSYDRDASKNWVQEMMHNNGYDIVDNEGRGDCLFATIRDAFSMIGQQTTVDRLRDKVAREVTQSIYQSYRDKYFTLKEYYDASKKTRDEKKKEFELRGTQAKNEKDSAKQRDLVKMAKLIKIQYHTAAADFDSAESLFRDVMIMEKAPTLEKFQQLVRTCNFWADEWAISTLERILNIKFITLSSKSYEDKDYATVLKCGISDTTLAQRTSFTPEYYIIIDFTGHHYKLIGYNGKHIFKFSEIPFDLKMLIVDKCLERNNGLFALISDFVHFKNEMIGRKAEIPGLLISSKDQDREVIDVDADSHMEELSESKLRGLYDGNIVFEFYNNASQKLPGKGPHEAVPSVDVVQKFAALNKVEDWRKKLDDSWTPPPTEEKQFLFELDGHTWNSVEHYMEANKFKNHPDLYITFAADSGTALSKDAEMAKAVASSSRKYKGHIVRSKNIEPDSDYLERLPKLHADGLGAKFSQNPLLAHMLALTQNAKLVHYRKGSPAELAEDLIQLRARIKK